LRRESNEYGGSDGKGQYKVIVNSILAP
jgi:hypothetical protein